MRRVVVVGRRSIAGHGLMHPTANLSVPPPYFTFLREPITRCLSLFEQIKPGRRQGRNLTFEECIEMECVRDGQVRQIAGEYSVDKAKQENCRATGSSV